MIFTRNPLVLRLAMTVEMFIVSILCRDDLAAEYRWKLLSLMHVYCSGCGWLEYQECRQSL